MSRIESVYADGGVIGKNPSSVGVTWAWCHVGRMGGRIAGQSGFVPVEQLKHPTRDWGSNNVAETLALLYGLEALPDGWSGPVWSDSEVGLRRIRNAKTVGPNWLPTWIEQRMRDAVARLGHLGTCLVAGHPTQKQLAEGHRDGVPVSIHNVWCDEMCGAEAGRLRFADVCGLVESDQCSPN